jgi:hypothetical protein
MFRAAAGGPPVAQLERVHRCDHVRIEARIDPPAMIPSKPR